MSDTGPNKWVERHYDPVDQERLQDPYPAYKQLRDKCPLGHSDKYEDGGFWILSRYEDVKNVLQDHNRFASGPSLSIPALGSQFPLLPVESNPPRHTAIRKLLTRALSPSSVTEREQRVREIVIETIDAVVRKRECDLIPDFAFPIPARTMFHPPLIGNPLLSAGENWVSDFQHWVHTFKVDPANSAVAAQKIVTYLEDLLTDRAASPQDDIPSDLMASLREGGDLTRDEVLGIMFVVFMGGIETPANAIGLALLHYARDPGLQEFIRKDPNNAASAVEEILRFYGPSQGNRRTLTEEVELHGQTLKKGDAVWVMYNSADRDERVFEAPEELKYDRKPNMHLGFGAGIHRCLGAPLGRLMLRTILQELAVRAPRFRVTDESALRYTMGVSRSLLSLPVAFDV